MVGAIKSVEDGMSLRAASRMYNVPLETLRRRVNGSVDIDCRPGPSSVLSKEEEDALALYIVKMVEMGFGLSREDVMRVAFVIAEKTGKKHPFKDGMAGRGWFDGFRARHPKLTLRTPQPLLYNRALGGNADVIKDFFAKLGAIYARLNILSKPMLIYNMDETSVSIVHKVGKVVAQVGRRMVWSLTSGEKGKTHTIVTCVSASGFVLPPMIIYPRKKGIPDNFKKNALPGTAFENSETGWINQNIYAKWFQYFLVNIPPMWPVLLILDGHSSHITIETIELARSQDVHLLCLPSHSTHILNPLDIGVFKSFKSFFSKACHKYVVSNPGRVITTDLIASLVGEAWPQSVTPINIMGGFKKSGVYPLNPGAVSDRTIIFNASNPPLSHSKSDNALDQVKDPESPSAFAFTPEENSLYETRYKEGYDIPDPNYLSWLRIHHPDSACSVGGSNSSASVVLSSCSTVPHNTLPTTTSGVISSNSSDVLSEVLVLPDMESVVKKRKRKDAVNTCKTVPLTDTIVYESLKQKEEEKAAEEALKVQKRKEREEKRQQKREEKAAREKLREEKKKAKEQKKKEKEQKKREKLSERKTVCAVVTRSKSVVSDLQALAIDDNNSSHDNDSADESDAECPKCGLVYHDDDSLWVCCDHCNTWYDSKCANIDSGNVPETWYCDDCDC